MSETLLRTKLFIPPLRPNFVPRPQLIERLNQGIELGHKLTLISAPAGFGKTTLVSEWVGSLRSDVAKESLLINRVAWLSLDEGDNDLTRFLAYLVAALNQVEGIETPIGKGAMGMLQSPQSPPAEAVLTSLINDVAANSDRILLVLDDYHLIDTSPVDDALTFFLAHLPPQMHLVISTRIDPNLPVARHRAQGQLTELRAVDLRFASSEIAKFLNQMTGLDLAAEDIAALETRTEGWIAGLQLAALALQGAISIQEHASLIQTFTGSHHFVLDYLIEEVLEQQSESVQIFLLQTAVLNRLTGPLCDALTGQDNGQVTLEMLEHANLFLIPLDEERRWYRYHHLFADLLRQRLQRNQPDWVPKLHLQASEWYEQNGFADQSIEHALRAESFERATQLIEKVAEAVWVAGEDSKLRRWLDGLPVEMVCSKPQLCIIYTWCLLGSGDMDTADRVLQAAEMALESNLDDATDLVPEAQGSPDDLNKLKLQGRIAATRAFSAFYHGNVPEIIEQALLALEYLPEHDGTWRSIAIQLLGDGYDFKGEMVEAYHSRVEALEVSRATGNSFQIMIAHLKLAIVLRHQGRLQQVIEVCRQQLQLANESGLSQTVVAGWSLAIWGEVLAEINDLDEAIHQAEMGVKLTERGGDLAMLGWSYLCLIRVLFSRGDFAEAEKIVRKIENTARETYMPPWIMNLKAAWQARLWLAQGELEAASQWVGARDLDAAGAPTYLHEMEYIVLARLLIAQGQLDEATSLLQRLLEATEAGGRTSRVIEVLILQALSFQAQEDTDQAIITLEKALTLAETGGFIRIFVDEGPPMARLLYEARTRGIAPDYARRLSAAFSVSEPKPAELSIMQASVSELIEPLSERELEVLHLIAEGLTNQEIASRLFLSLNTVKVHTRNIYGKLDAHNRTMAVARGRVLGILPST